MTRAGEIIGHGVPALADLTGKSVTLKAQRGVQSDRDVTAIAVGTILGTIDPELRGVVQRRSRIVTFYVADVLPIEAWRVVVIDGVEWTLQQPPVQRSEKLVAWEANELMPGELNRGSIHKVR